MESEYQLFWFCAAEESLGCEGAIEGRDGGSISVSVNICIFWSIGLSIGISGIEKYSIGIGKNNTDPQSLIEGKIWGMFLEEG